MVIKPRAVHVSGTSMQWTQFRVHRGSPSVAIWAASGYVCVFESLNGVHCTSRQTLLAANKNVESKKVLIANIQERKDNTLIGRLLQCKRARARDRTTDRAQSVVFFALSICCQCVWRCVCMCWYIADWRNTVSNCSSARSIYSHSCSTYNVCACGMPTSAASIWRAKIRRQNGNNKLAKFMHTHTHAQWSIRSTKKGCSWFSFFVLFLFLSLPRLSAGWLSRFCSSSINGLTSPSRHLCLTPSFTLFANCFCFASFALLKLINFIINFDTQ